MNQKFSRLFTPARDCTNANTRGLDRGGGVDILMGFADAHLLSFLCYISRKFNLMIIFNNILVL